MSLVIHVVFIFQHVIYPILKDVENRSEIEDTITTIINSNLFNITFRHLQ